MYIYFPHPLSTEQLYLQAALAIPFCINLPLPTFLRTHRLEKMPPAARPSKYVSLVPCLSGAFTRRSGLFGRLYNPADMWGSGRNPFRSCSAVNSTPLRSFGSLSMPQPSHGYQDSGRGVAVDRVGSVPRADLAISLTGRPAGRRQWVSGRHPSPGPLSSVDLRR